MQSVQQAMERLASKGYTTSCRAVPSGQLQFGNSHKAHEPHDLVVDETVRIEGDSSPGEETLIFALHSKNNHKAVYCVAFGHEMSMADTDAVLQLNDAATHH